MNDYSAIVSNSNHYLEISNYPSGRSAADLIFPWSNSFDANTGVDQSTGLLPRWISSLRRRPGTSSLAAAKQGTTIDAVSYLRPGYLVSGNLLSIYDRPYPPRGRNWAPPRGSRVI